MSTFSATLSTVLLQALSPSQRRAKIVLLELPAEFGTPNVVAITQRLLHARFAVVTSEWASFQHTSVVRGILVTETGALVETACIVWSVVTSL